MTRSIKVGVWLLAIGVLSGPAASSAQHTEHHDPEHGSSDVFDHHGVPMSTMLLLKAKMRTVQHVALNPVIVRAVRQQNADGLSPDVIAKRDEAWQASGEDVDFKRSLMESPAGMLLADFVRGNESVSEAFVIDAQGANVAVFPGTSDYYQGDEEKWIQAFNGGNGRVHLDPPKVDESTGIEALQISAPVIDKGHTIGVVTVGVTIDYIADQE